MMKKRKQRYKKILLSVLALIAVSFSGCDERYRENDRIWQKADKIAEKQAVEYIREKYGIEATPLGHETQGRSGMFVHYAEPHVLVPMSYQDELFCVGVNVDDKTQLSDNRQGKEISTVLMQYFVDLYDLPMPEYFQVKFYLREMPRFHSYADIAAGKPIYDTSNMVNFLFENQSAKEVLKQIERIEYEHQYSALPDSLNTIELSPADWPLDEDFTLLTWVGLSLDKGTKLPVRGTFADSKLSPQHWQYFQEWLYTGIWNTYSGQPETGRAFYSFQSTVQDGFLFVAQLQEPDTSLSIENMLQRSEEKRSWKKENTMGDGRIHVTEYEQISNQFEMIREEALKSSYSLVMNVPDEFVKKEQGELYFGKLNQESGAISIGERIWKNGEREGSRDSLDYRTTSIKHQLMQPGYRYAILKKTAEYDIPPQKEP